MTKLQLRNVIPNETERHKIIKYHMIIVDKGIVGSQFGHTPFYFLMTQQHGGDVIT